MDIQAIIYQTTREVFNLDDKLRIATIFLFCEQLGSEKLSRLLYCDDHAKFIQELNYDEKEDCREDVQYEYTSRGYQLADRMLSRLIKVGEKYFDESEININTHLWLQ